METRNKWVLLALGIITLLIIIADSGQSYVISRNRVISGPKLNLTTNQSLLQQLQVERQKLASPYSGAKCTTEDNMRQAMALRSDTESFMCQLCFKDGVQDALYTLGFTLQPHKKTAAPRQQEQAPMISFPLKNGFFVINLSQYKITYELLENHTLEDRDGNIRVRPGNGTLKLYVK